MSDLTPEDRALLNLARGGGGPTHADRARIRGALLARVGVGAGLAGTTVATSKAATVTLMWTKVLATLVVTGAVGSAGIATYRATWPARGQGVAMSSTGTNAEASKELGAPPAAPAPVVRLPDRDEKAGGHATQPTGAVFHPPATAQIVAILAQPASPAPPEASSAMPEPLAPLVPTTLEAETRLVRAGVGALHTGDATRALALFDEHARLFPRGALAEERAAERVIALGEMRRCDEARTAAASFLRDHPSSPLAARVRAVCTTTPNP